MKTPIPSPIPYLLKIQDSRKPKQLEHTQETLWTLVLLALSTRQENILAIAQWVEDQHDWLLNTVGLRTRSGQAKLPSQASLYRFLWSLEQDITALETALSCWAQALLNTHIPSSQLVCVNADGKYLLDTARPRSGQSALVLVSAFLSELGVTLTQTLVTSTEAQAVKTMINTLKTTLPQGSWVLTTDAGITERDLAAKITKAGGDYFMRLKRNQPEALEMSHWVFHYPLGPTGTAFFEEEYRSGELWSWDVRASSALPDELRLGFPAIEQVVRLERRVTRLDSGETRVEETFALTSLTTTAQELYGVWRGHWGIENRLHHKRDEVFKEDRCRTRKAGQSLAALRNAILSLLHLSGDRVLRCVRRFACQPGLMLAFLGLEP
jgi:DDE_Tnp_1-associated/Transposase DDE domain